MSVVFLIIIGAAAGLIATRVMRLEADLPTTIAIGVVGAVIGGLVLRTLIAVMGLLAGLVGAILGAILLIYFWQRLRQR